MKNFMLVIAAALTISACTVAANEDFERETHDYELAQSQVWYAESTGHDCTSTARRSTCNLF